MVAKAQKKASKAATAAKASKASTTPGAVWASDNGIKTTSKGETHCFKYNGEGHWVKDRPELSTEQQGQCNGVTQMNSADEEDSSEDESQYEEDDGFQGLQSANDGTRNILDGHKLYLDSCITYNSCFIKKILDIAMQV